MLLIRLVRKEKIMDDVGRCTLFFGLAVFCLLIAALFSASNEAYDDAGVSRLRKLWEEEEDKRAKSLLRLQSKTLPYSLRVNLCGAFLLFLAAVFLLFGILTLTTVWWQILICLWAGVQLILFFGLALPRVLAETDPTSFALKMQRWILFCWWIVFPFTEPALKLSECFAKRNVQPQEEDSRAEEEIRLLVDAGTDAGTIEASENEMIDNIFEFDDRTVGEVMTHRTDVFAVEEKTGLQDILNVAISEGVSRIPVYRGRIDTVIGILYAKDLLKLVAEPETAFQIEDFIRPVLYTPEQTMCNTLFREFQQKKIHFAVVVDEYGGTAGIVTMEDLLEAIVGNIEDEYDHEENMIVRCEDGSYLINGDLELERAQKLLNITFPETDGADTLGGAVIGVLQRIPEEGEAASVEVEDWILTVNAIANQHIEQIRAVPKPKVSIDDQPEETGD